MRKEVILLIVEKYILPLFFLSQAFWVIVNLPQKGWSLLQVSSILKPILIALLMFMATKRQRAVNLKTTIGLLLSFGSIYFVTITDKEFSKFSSLLLSSSLIFYIALSFVAIFNLGRSFSILPSANSTTTSGLYSLVRHPIYSSYIHTFFIFVIIHFNLLNASLLILFYIGLLLRAIEEEELLKTDISYTEKMFQIPRFFTTVFTMPIILIIASISIDQFKGTKKKTSLNISGPIYSLIPTNADDWSSFFVMNHIYPRFFRRPGEFRSNSVITEKNLYCEDKDSSLLSSSCKRVVLKFTLKEGFIGCNQKLYTISHFRKELESILLSKNWILPNFKWCNKSSNCITFDNVPNIQNHLESIYLKFGWSLFKEDDSLVGIKPNCFSVKSKPEGKITEGTLITKNWTLDISTNDKDPDIFLFENSFSTQTHNNVKFFNPIYYFFLANGDSKNRMPRWVSMNLLNTITEEFSRNGIFQNIKKNEYLLSEFKQYQFNFKSYSFSNTSKVIIIPDYLENCSDIAFRIKQKIQVTDPNITFECTNISEFIEFGVKRGGSWDAFIGPLTPGLPGKNALATQYFNESSTDHWLGRKYPTQTRVALLGISHGSMLLKKNKFCSIIPNSLGLSDLTIDDFQNCSY